MAGKEPLLHHDTATTEAAEPGGGGGLPAEDERLPLEVALLRRLSMYALTPNQKWAELTLVVCFLGLAYFMLALLCFFVDPGNLAIRLVYTVMAVSGLVYRVGYFARREWLLYFIDLCFVTSIILVISMWSCPILSCPETLKIAVYAVSSGPVPGATFMLQTPLTLHHPEAFESFFLHATPMWIMYYCRWRWDLFELTPSLLEIIWYGLSRIYLPWALVYLAFLLLQPFMCDWIAGWETLMDGFVFGGESTHVQRMREKRGNYPSYAAKIVGFVLGHAVLSVSGFLAAAMAFRDWRTQVVWLICVQIGCIISGYNFYAQSLDPGRRPPGFLVGFARMGLAWCVVLPTYLTSEGVVFVS